MYSYLGSVTVGDNYPVRIMGIINLSPESFYKGSVSRNKEEITKKVQNMIDGRVDIIDFGAMSTAPYLENNVSLEKEIERLSVALKAVKDIDKSIVISVDTFRSKAAEFALSKGASVVNDVTGLKGDEKMKKVVKEYDASLILMAYDPEGNMKKSPIRRVKDSLIKSLEISDGEGISRKRIVIDPGIGFFREEGMGITFSRQKVMPWYEWDICIIKNIDKIKRIGLPLCISLSRKSFIGKILGIEKPKDRFVGSIAATAVAVEKGANLIRTHDVLETYQAVRIAESIKLAD